GRDTASGGDGGPAAPVDHPQTRAHVRDGLARYGAGRGVKSLLRMLPLARACRLRAMWRRRRGRSIAANRCLADHRLARPFDQADERQNPSSGTVCERFATLLSFCLLLIQELLKPEIIPELAEVGVARVPK